MPENPNALKSSVIVNDLSLDTPEKFLKDNEQLVIESVKGEKNGTAQNIEIYFYNRNNRLCKYRIIPTPDNPLKKFIVDGKSVRGAIKFREYVPPESVVSNPVEPE